MPSIKKRQKDHRVDEYIERVRKPSTPARMEKVKAAADKVITRRADVLRRLAEQ